MFNNLIIGDINSGVLRSEVVDVEHDCGSVICGTKFVCDEISNIKIFSNVSS